MTMNKPIRTIATFCLVLFLALMVNATYLQYHAASDLIEDPRNRRVIDAAYSRERGAILVNRDSLAVSREVDDQFEFLRAYPRPLRYAHVTGYFSYLYGAAGVERSQNAVLSGDDSRLFVTQLVDLVSQDDSEGGNVQLTLDQAAQDAAFDGLEALPGEARGAVVALEPSSGKVLAMVSMPSYDPNVLSSHDFSAVEEAWERLSSNPAEPLVNRAIQTTLPPGSTFKVVTAAAAIEAGLYSADDLVPGGDTYQLPLTEGETGLIDNEGRACGGAQIPFTQALGQSCNTTFAALADEVGAEGMREVAEGFGFNTDYLEDLRPQALSVYPEDPNRAELGQTGIGQFDVRATPLQMAMVVAGIANGGVVMRPYLVDEVLSADYDVLDKTEPDELSEAVSPQTADQVTDLMVATVEEGTATAAQIQGVTVAGKTGTAQSGDPDRPPYAWFVAFAPDEDVAVAVVIENADIERSEVAGGRLGGPIAKAVMEAVIRQ
ncbi:peptidoglycan D,D-transpeptidase FtsI family protein [Nocardioides sp. SYSU DS0663]|uniref:peptidoglycan D,D-transpeptidase FtsI family protein n=1 Tax=Nocardioides sp. SYSU DS0663 TaxID=3416445 RepID=UPI003F4C8D17